MAVNEWTNDRSVPGYPETTEHGEGVSHTDHDNMSSSVSVDGKTVKRFKGESAWSNAQRHAGDLFNDRRYKKR